MQPKSKRNSMSPSNRRRLSVPNRMSSRGSRSFERSSAPQSMSARSSKTKPPTQRDVAAMAVERVLGTKDDGLADWISELGRAYVTTSGETADYSVLESHLRRFTARNTFDYFIHKDLGVFFRRELDF